MFNRSFVLVALIAVPCFGASYNPKDIFFDFLATQGKGHFPEFPYIIASITATMRNVPLYFVPANGTRDYVKNVSFMVAKHENGTHHVRYKVLSSYRCEDMVLKDVKKDVIDAALKDSFPNLEDAFFKEFLTAIPAPSGQIVYTVESLYELKESEDNRERFLNAMKFVNHFIPVEKLRFDENDLLVPEVKKTINQSSWFSLKAWRDWFRS